MEREQVEVDQTAIRPNNAVKHEPSQKLLFLCIYEVDQLSKENKTSHEDY